MKTSTMNTSQKNRWLHVGIMFLFLIFTTGLGWGQTPNGFLTFGTTANGTTATTGNTGFGGVRVGTQGGGFAIMNPGQAIGTDAELRGIAPTGGSINSVGITSTEFGTDATTFTVSFEVYFTGGASGTWYFFAGNGTSFGSAQSTGFTSNQVFTGISWVFGVSNTITTNNRNAGNWNATGISGTPFAQNISYFVTIVGNNSASTVNYGLSQSVASFTYDLWVNGTLVGNDLAKAQLANETSINAFRFYGESSTGNVATIAIDNIRWYNTCVLPPTHLAFVGVPANGTVSTNLSSFTVESRSGSATGPLANAFTGNVTVAKASGSGSISGTLSPSSTAGVANFSDIQFNAADTYTMAASSASPILSATSSSIVISSAAAPTISVSVVSLDFEKVYSGYYSRPQKYTVTGSNLTGNITVTAPTGIEVTTTCGSGYGGSVSLPPSGGSVNATVYARYTGGTISGNITHASSGAATQNIAISETSSITNKPGTYYNLASGTGQTLKWSLQSIIKGHTKRTYDNLWDDFEDTDALPNGKVWDMYSDKGGCVDNNYYFTFVTDQDGGSGGTIEGQKFNREHSFPNSWWGGSTTDTMYTDLFHIVPSDKYVNAQRANYEYGTVGTPSATYTNGSKLGNNSFSGSAGATAFEPIDAYKGDFARAYFYMATRYANKITSWTTSPMIDGDINDSDGSVFEEWALNMLIEWHESDPVDQKEMSRNDAIYLIQGNRNPFIDNPGYVAAIWGIEPSITISTEALTGFTYAEGAGPSTAQSFTISGADLTNNISIVASTNYEISLASGSGYTSSITLNQTGGTVGSTPIYVRLKSGLSAGNYNSEVITASSIGATSKTVTCSGTVINYPDWCNLQHPSSGSIFTGGAFNVYAQIYEDGVTNGLGQGSGISCWIGYSLSNTNPNTWTNWVAATYNTDNGNNDEYMANIGSSLPAGTYYYASRFTVDGTNYSYGGYNGGFWNGTTNVSGTLTVSINYPDWCNLQHPASGSINLGDAFNVYARIYEGGVTDGAGQGTGITCQIGYSTENTNPNTWTNWVNASYYTDYGNDDEYVADIGTPLLLGGTYYYASRFSVNGTDYSYGGYSAGGGNFWDGITYVSGTVTVASTTCGNESFSNLPTTSSGSYLSRSWTGDNGLTWTAEGARTDQTINGKAICWGTSGTRNLITPVYENGMGRLDFDYVRAFTGTEARSFEVYINSTLQTSVSVSSTSDDVQTFSHAIETTGNITLEIRSTGSGQVKIDNISWTCFSTSSPKITLSPTSLSGLGYYAGNGPGNQQSFDIAAINLTENISVLPSENYEISTQSGGLFTPTNPIILTPIGGNVTATVYVRLKAGLAVGNYNNETILVSSTGANTKTVACSGSVIKSNVSDFIAVSSSESATVSSIENTAGPLTSTQGVQVWQFTIRDGGELGDDDALPTVVNTITFTRGTGNSMMDWSDALLSADLFDGETHLGIGIITDNQLQFSGSPLITVTDNSSKTLTLRVSIRPATLNSTVSRDGFNFRFQISQSNVTAAATGSSGFVSFTAISSESGKNLLAVEASKLLFVQQPSNVNINAVMSPSVTIEATDAHGNRDLDFSGVGNNVTVTSTGTFSVSATKTVQASSGVATFSNLLFSVPATNRTLSTTNTFGFTNATSSAFDIANVPVTIVEWNFPNNPDNATADGGITENLSKTISTVGGTGTIGYTTGGATTQSASANGWDSGEGTKYWQIEFVTSGYATLSVSSKQRSSSTGPRDFKVQFKIGSGGTWTDITGGTITVADNFTIGVATNLSLPTGCSNQSSVYIRWIMSSNTSVGGGTVGSTGTSRIDDIVIKGYSIAPSCTTPENQPTDLAFSNIAGTSMQLNWANGDGENVLVVAKQGSLVTSTPSDNTTYDADSHFGVGDEIESGEFVVYAGTSTTVTLTGLSANTNYHFALFSYNCSAGNELYLTTNPLTGSQGTINYVSTSTILGSPFCVTADNGIAVTIDFTYAASGDFAGSTFIAQLSGNSGSFDSPVTLGTVVSNTTGSQTISGIIPAGTTSGTGYRIRVISDSPAITGTDNGTNLTIVLGPENATFSTVVEQNGQVVLNWTNPLACFNDVIIVAGTASINATPSGNGSGYSANPSFGSGFEIMSGEYVVYNGTGTSVTVTNLSNDQLYHFKIFTRNGLSWSSGVETTALPTGPTILSFGDIVVVGLCSNVEPCGLGSPGDDEISFFCFKNIATNTVIDLTDNGWERNFPNYWGTGEGFTRVRRTGSTIPAGKVVTIRLKNSNPYFVGVSPDGDWVVESNIGSTILNANGDQLFFMQGGAWSSSEGTNKGTYKNGSTVIAPIFAFNTNNTWTRLANSSQHSGLPGDMDCFSMMPGVAADYIKYVGPLSQAPQRQWVSRINNAANWTNYANCTQYYANGPNYTNGDSIFVIGTGAYEEGTWYGYRDTLWSQCGNWGSLVVPVASNNITIPTLGVLKKLYLDADSTFECNNLNILNPSFVLGGGNNSKLVVNGSVIINKGKIQLPNQTTLEVKGNWEQDTLTSFVPGNSTLMLSGNGNQTVTINGDGVQMLTIHNLIASGSGNKYFGIEVDSVKITGNLTIQGSAILNPQNSAFSLDLKGNFNSYGQSAFDTLGVTVVFSGTGKQTLSTTGGQAFTKMKISNSSAGGVELSSNLIITDQLDLGSQGILKPGPVARTITLSKNTEGSIGLKGSNDAKIDLSDAAHILTMAAETPSFTGSIIGGTTSSINYIRNGSQNILSGTGFAYRNLTLSNSGVKTISDDIYISGNMTVDASVVNFPVEDKKLELDGNLTLQNFGSFHDNCKENLEISIKGINTQTFAGNGNPMKAKRLVVDKTDSNFILNSPANSSNVEVFESASFDMKGTALLTDNGNTIQTDDDAYFGGSGHSNYNLTGKLIFTGENVTGDMHISDLSGTGMTVAQLPSLEIKDGNLMIYPLGGGETLVVKGNFSMDNSVNVDFNGNNLNVGGNYTVSNNADFNANDITILFNGTGNQTIQSGDSETFGNLAVNKPSGTVLLNCNINVDTLTLTSGTITTGSNSLILTNPTPGNLSGNFANSYISGNLRRTVASSGAYDFPVGLTTGGQVLNIDIASATGLSYIDVFFNSIAAGATDIRSLGLEIGGTTVPIILNAGYWTINSNPELSAIEYDMTLNLRGATNTGSTANQHTIIRRDNSSSNWGFAGVHDNSTQSMGGGIVSAKRTALTGFSDYAVATSDLWPLPIELLYFNATKLFSHVQLQWATASECNNHFFTVERSADLKAWAVVGNVDGAGNSSTTKTYSLMDTKEVVNTVYYRLKQTDFDGRFKYSEIVSVSNNQIGGNGIELYPNPNNGLLMVSGVTSQAQVKIYDIVGQLVIDKQLLPGHNTVDLSQQPNGVYFVTVIMNELKTTRKIILSK
jgi:endonuclease I